MPKSNNNSKNSPNNNRVNPIPFTGEEILKLKNEQDKEIPETIKKELSNPKVYIQGIPKSDIDSYFKSIEQSDGILSIKLQSNMSIGLPGRSGERIERNSAIKSKDGSTSPYKPDWSGMSYTPRPAMPFRHSRIRTIEGRTIEAFYGIYNNPDARQVFYPSDYPWRCTGRIFTYTNWPTPNWSWSGSGVLVGPRHVLTAGHVAPWGSPNWAMLFVPAYWDGASIYGSGASSYISDYRGWNTGGGTAHDSCVLRLYEPLGNQLGWIGSKTYDDDWEGGSYWTLTGYPGAIASANRPAYQSGVAVLDDDVDGDAQQIEHHGDSSPGESGGPMFGFWDDGPYAIGTTSGGETISGGPFGIGDEDNNIAAGGNAMVDLIKWAQNNWP